MSTGSTRYSHFSGSRYTYGNGRSNNVTKGDVLILHDGGIPFTSLSNVDDPHGLVELIKSLVKQRLDSLDT
jgi:hypothetical protein